jgi:pSer/pThr/pTyr-binding forkhead associated (FHA) protein
MARLEVLYRDQLVGEYRMGPGKTIIGRTADNDVQIQSRFISRHHAQVVSDQTRSILEDLNSTNGVFIRSERVKHQELVDGDVIQIGEHKLLYRDMRSAGARGADDDEDDDDLDELDDEDEENDADGLEEEDEEEQNELGERGRGR